MAGERLRQALQSYRKRYRKATRIERSRLLDEFCQTSGYHRKYAIALLNQPEDAEADRPRRRRGTSYSTKALKAIEAIWKAAGHPWSVRLKALLPAWLPWACKHLDGLTPELQRQVLSISARQIDRRLRAKKRRLKAGIYGRTKPGTLLRHQVPVRVEAWDVQEPGYTQIDLVSHSGPSASGEFGYSLNVTDIYSGWCESAAVLGRGERGVVAALENIRRTLPFHLHEIHSDNGSEFINHHLIRYCKEQRVDFTRGRPYNKDDNAHVEQKNWTHVRRVFGWERYDRPEVIEAMNDLYGGELRIMMNLFQPSVKLVEKVRNGARLTRRYDSPLTPLDRLIAWYGSNPKPPELRSLIALRQRTDPFELSAQIERKLRRIEDLRSSTPAQRWARKAAQRVQAPQRRGVQGPDKGGRRATSPTRCRPTGTKEVAHAAR